AGKHPNLTVLHFAQGATILPRDAHGVLALFDKTRLVEHQDTRGVPHLFGHELVVVPEHLLLIPDDITEKPLHPTDGAPLDVESHGLDRLAFELTQLAHHIVEEIGTRLTPCKTIVEDGLERPEFLREPFHIPRADVKSRAGRT